MTSFLHNDLKVIKEMKASARNRVLLVRGQDSPDPLILKVYKVKFRNDFEMEARILRELNKGVVFLMGYPQLKSIKKSD